MFAGDIKVFFAISGNFLSNVPDTVYSAHAMQRCKLTAHVSTKLNRSHLITGERALILPCLGRTEEDIQATGKQFSLSRTRWASSIRKASCRLLPRN